MEPRPQMWVEHLVDLFLQIKPALKPTACVFVNLGDSYFSQGGSRPDGCEQNQSGLRRAKRAGQFREWRAAPDGWLRPKQLLGLPWRFAIAMQEAGFLLRNEIIWAKPNAMPSSVRDRFSCRHEHLFLFSLAERYYFDLEAVREPHSQATIERGRYGSNEDAKKWATEQAETSGFNAWNNHEPGRNLSAGGANPGDFWVIAPKPFPEAHFATFPPKLIERPLKAGCPREVCVQCGKPKVRETRVSYGPKPGWGAGSANARRREIEDDAVQAWDPMPRLQHEVDTLG